jgi:hypothetical protein
MSQLRKDLIRLAYEKPELREHVLPLVASQKKAAVEPDSPALAVGRSSAEIVLAIVKEMEKLLKKEGDFASMKVGKPGMNDPYRASATVEFRVEYQDGRKPQGGWIAVDHGFWPGRLNPRISASAYFMGRQETLQKEAPVNWDQGPKTLGPMVAKIVVDNFMRVFAGSSR